MTLLNHLESRGTNCCTSGWARLTVLMEVRHLLRSRGWNLRRRSEGGEEEGERRKIPKEDKRSGDSDKKEAVTVTATESGEIDIHRQ
jgi:hypothetical protein